jgi:hypothetical protein
MVKAIAVNSNNDLFIGPSANFVVLEGLPAVLQICAQAVKAQLGEMVLNTDRGIPNFEVTWKGAPNIAQLENALRKTLLRVQGVIEISDLTINIQNNILIYRATILTSFGQGILSNGGDV